MCDKGRERDECVKGASVFVGKGEGGMNGYGCVCVCVKGGSVFVGKGEGGMNGCGCVCV